MKDADDLTDSNLVAISTAAVDILFRVQRAPEDVGDIVCPVVWIVDLVFPLCRTPDAADDFHCVVVRRLG